MSHSNLRLAARSYAFFFDFDGTLADIAPTPDTVSIPAHLTENLRLMSVVTSGAVALISGRSITTLDRLLHPLRLPAGGLHGLERRNSGLGSIEAPIDGRLLDPARRMLTAIVHDDPRLVLEDKGLAVALHYRQAVDRAQDAAAAIYLLAEELGPAGDVKTGKMTVELRLAGPDKGAALHGLMDSPPFVGRLPVMFGDDLTDQAAFRAACLLGGFAVHVGPLPPPACATHQVDGPWHVRALVAQIAHGGEAEIASTRAKAPMQ